MKLRAGRFHRRVSLASSQLPRVAHVVHRSALHDVWIGRARIRPATKNGSRAYPHPPGGDDGSKAREGSDYSIADTRRSKGTTPISSLPLARIGSICEVAKIPKRLPPKAAACNLGPVAKAPELESASPK